MTYLSQHVYWEFPPWEFPKHTIRKRNCRIQVSTRNTRRVDTKHDAQPPAPGDGLVVSVGSAAENDLCNDTIAEHEDHERSHELREWFPECPSDPWPAKSSIRSLHHISRWRTIDECAMFGIRRHSGIGRVVLQMVVGPRCGRRFHSLDLVLHGLLMQNFHSGPVVYFVRLQVVCYRMVP